MQIKKALVTGGGGFLGKVIVRKLLENDISVTSLSRQRYPDLDEMGVVQVQADLSDKSAVARALEGQNAVFHVAAKFGMVGSYEQFYNTNVKGTQNIIDACFSCGVEQLVYTSSPSVIMSGTDQENVDETVAYPSEYTAHYPATKAEAEKRIIKASQDGLKTIILRPHLIWGPGDNHFFLRVIKRGKALKKIGRTDDLIDIIYVDNAADAHLLASKRLSEDPSLSGNIYFISQDEPISKWELADAFFKIAGLPPVNGHVSAGTAIFIGSVFEIIYKLFGIKKEPPITRWTARELSTSHWFNITKAKTQLGYRPNISTEEGLVRLKQWYDTIR